MEGIESPLIFSFITAASLGFAVLIDLLLGDPEVNWHPVMLLGKTLARLRDFFRTRKPLPDRAGGVAMVLLSCFIFCLPPYLLSMLSWEILVRPVSAGGFLLPVVAMVVHSFVNGVLLKWTFAIKKLGDAVRPIKAALDEGSLKEARDALSYIVRRDTRVLDVELVISAAVECIAESSTDSATGVFWFYGIGNVVGCVMYRIFNLPWLLFLGIPAAWLYRVINTWDSVAGYKDPVNLHVGWFAARLDDAANFIPARLTVLVMLVVGATMDLDCRNGIRSLSSFKNATESVNAGWTMSLVAGLLGVQLEKAGSYKLGFPSRKLHPDDMDLAFSLVKFTMLVVALTMAISACVAGIILL